MTNKAQFADCEISLTYAPKNLFIATIGYKGGFAGSAGLTYEKNHETLELSLGEKPEQKDYFFFNRLLIFPAFRERGLGSILLDHVLRKADKEGINIFSSVNPYGEMSKEDTIAFYKRHGLKELQTGSILYVAAQQ